MRIVIEDAEEKQDEEQILDQVQNRRDEIIENFIEASQTDTLMLKEKLISDFMASHPDSPADELDQDLQD